MITTLLAVFDISRAEYVLWPKGLNTPVTQPLQEKHKTKSISLDRAFWEGFIKEQQVTHLLVLTPVDYAVASKKLQSLLSGLCTFAIIPSALAAAYGCNQGQLLVLSPHNQDGLQVVPVIDYQVQVAYSQVIEYRESIGRVIWECAQQAGMDHPGRTALLLENICIVGVHDIDVNALKADLEMRLPVTAFAGDPQPKKIGFRSTPEYHGPIANDMISFFGALIAARAIFSTESLYQK